MDINTGIKIQAIAEQDFHDLWNVFGMRISEYTEISVTHFRDVYLSNGGVVQLEEWWLPESAFCYCAYEDGIAYLNNTTW